jgi:hypothetical protein
MGAKEDESSTGCIWAAGFHHVTAHSRLVGILKLMNHLFLQFSNFFSGRGELRILNQRIWGHACIRSHAQYRMASLIYPSVLGKR